MTAPSISTSGAGGPLFDVSSSVSAYSAQQSVAPFSSLLQQAQTPPSPAPAPPPPSPPEKRPRESSSATSSRSANRQDSTASAKDGSQTPSGRATDSAPGADQESAPAGQDASNDAKQSAGDQADPSAAPPGHDPTKTRAGTGAARAKTSSSKADDGQQGADVDTMAAQISGQAVLNAQPAKAGNEQQADGSAGKTSAGAKSTPPSSDDQTASLVPVDATAQASVPVVVTTAGEKDHAGTAQAVTTASDTASADALGLKDSLASANQRQVPNVAPSPGKPQQPVANTEPTADAAGAGVRPAGQPQGGANGFVNQLTKAAVGPGVASQATATTQSATTADGATNVGPAVPTVPADATQAAPPPTVDAGKAADAALPSSTNGTAQTTAAAAPVDTSTSNGHQAGPSGPTTYTANSPSQSTASQGAGPSGPSTVDRARFVQRVTRAFQAVGAQGGEIRLRLSPPELGSLQMQISVKDGGMTAHIQADNSTAQRVLLESLPDLRARLAQQDIHIEHFDVQLAGQSSGGMPQSPQGNPDFDQAGRRSSVGNNSRTASVAAETDLAASASVSVASGALNVVV